MSSSLPASSPESLPSALPSALTSPTISSPAPTRPRAQSSRASSHDADPDADASPDASASAIVDAARNGDARAHEHAKQLVRPRRLSDLPGLQVDPSEFLAPSPTDFVTTPSDMDALAFLFNTVISFSESHRDTARGWHAELRDVYNQQGHGSLVQTAARATSLALLGSGRQSNSMVREGLVVHGQALSLLRETLQDPAASRSDATLLAVLLMSHFDFVVYAREGRPYLDAHGRILPALLRHRGTEQLDDPRSRRLFFNVQLQVVNSRLYGASHFDDPDDFLLLEDDSDHPGAVLNNMLKRIYRFQNSVARIKTRPSTAAHVQRALDDAYRIDQNLVNWSSSLRATWQFSLASPAQAKLRPRQYWKAIHRYPDLWICRIWNSYRTARIELHASTWNLMIWSSANHGTDHSEPQLRSQQIIQRMVDDVAASVPYAFGDVAIDESEQFSGPQRPAGYIKYKSHAMSMGWFLLNPIIRVTLKAPHVPEDEREWLKTQLVRCCQLGMIQAGSADYDYLVRQKQPVFAYSMPIVTLNDSQANEHQMLSPVNLPAPASPDTESEGRVSIERAIEEVEVAGDAKPFGSSLDLNFINTTRPGQTKDEGVQKKIRRDVMLNYHRKNTRKKMAEKQQQSQDGGSKSTTGSSSRKPG